MTKHTGPESSLNKKKLGRQITTVLYLGTFLDLEIGSFKIVIVWTFAQGHFEGHTYTEIMADPLHMA